MSDKKTSPDTGKGKETATTTPPKVKTATQLQSELREALATVAKLEGVIKTLEGDKLERARLDGEVKRLLDELAKAKEGRHEVGMAKKKAEEEVERLVKRVKDLEEKVERLRETSSEKVEEDIRNLRGGQAEILRRLSEEERPKAPTPPSAPQPPTPPTPPVVPPTPPQPLREDEGGGRLDWAAGSDELDDIGRLWDRMKRMFGGVRPWIFILVTGILLAVALVFFILFLVNDTGTEEKEATTPQKTEVVVTTAPVPTVSPEPAPPVALISPEPAPGPTVDQTARDRAKKALKKASSAQATVNSVLPEVERLGAMHQPRDEDECVAELMAVGSSFRTHTDRLISSGLLTEAERFSNAQEACR